jgi:translation initiation factor IF-2
MRVYELAKELGLTSKEVIERLAKLRVTVKGHMSAVDDAVTEKLRVQARPAAPVRPSPAKPAPAKASVTVDAKSSTKAKPAEPPKVEPPKPEAKPTATTPVKPVPAQPRAAPKPAAPVTAAPKPTPVPTLSVPPPAARPVAPVTPTPRPSAPIAPIAPARPAPVIAAPAPRSTGPVPVPATAATGGVAVEAPPEPAEAATKQIRLTFPISVKDLAAKMDVKANDLIKHLIGKRVFASLTQMLDQAVATQTAKDFGFEVAPQPTLEERLVEELAPDPAKMVSRAPVVTFMGHVDHGKTSLLDAIRKSKLAEKETGGITQHIGAYEVQLAKGSVTFLDTPGHEAFTALRARGAQVTDIVVLVVAADDGVMPQTIEAIDHAKAADVPIVVAVNKIDRPEANQQRVKQQLAQYGLQAEDWGGKTIMVPVSAKTGEGIDSLLEMLLLEAELLELKADPTKAAQGTVIEARLAADRGPIATLLVQQGTMRVGDLVVIGTINGRVRAMINDVGNRVKEAKPASAVEVLGLPAVPKAGEKFVVVTDEKTVRTLVERRQDQVANRSTIVPRRVTLEDLHQRITAGILKELKLVIKSDVQGSLDALTKSLEQIATQEVKLQILHMGVGDVSESDVMLAAASDAIVIGFRVGMDPRVQVEAVKAGVDVEIFQIIYELVNAIRSSIEGLLEPKIEETFLGRAEVKRLFQITKVGIVAGSFVTKGTIRRDAVIRVIRGRERLIETKIANLKRVKDDVREVQEGVECGISLEGNIDLQPGDLIEAWELKKVARKLQ